MTFASPYLLAALVLPVLALAGYLWLERRPPRAAISFPNLAVLASVATRSSWRRHLIAGLLLGAVALLCVAVARPRVPIDTTSDRATVVLVVDVSYSMVATDVDPEPARGSAGRDHLVRQPRAQSRQGRPRRLCRRPCRRHLADDQPRPPQGGHRVACARVRDGDR